MSSTVRSFCCAAARVESRMSATEATSRDRDVIIRMMCQLSRTTAALALAAAVLLGTALNDVLRRAGEYVRQFEKEVAGGITDERYEQNYPCNMKHEHRSLQSEMVYRRLQSKALS